MFDPFFTVREALEIQSGYYVIRNNAACDRRRSSEHISLTSKANTNMRALRVG